MRSVQCLCSWMLICLCELQAGFLLSMETTTLKRTMTQPKHESMFISFQDVALMKFSILLASKRNMYGPYYYITMKTRMAKSLGGLFITHLLPLGQLSSDVHIPFLLVVVYSLDILIQYVMLPGHR